MGTEIKNEILSPAGSLSTLYAGINAGADAVYIGGQKFGARAYAENPLNDELLRAIDYVHMHDKKIYLTVNTLLKNNEIENQLYDYLLPFYTNGLDAVIVQDLGVFQFIRNNFPDMDIHASTQMAITGVKSAELLKKLGAARVVTARELSLSELQEIHDKADMEIESFIHGAMCYSYSGMCLFSSIIGGRSGNRGRCAGPCRQPYEVYRDNVRLNDKNSLYALSLRDMNTLEIIPQILDAGVFSLKIEGRMKSPEYAAGVVSIYRKYVDLYNEKGSEGYKIDKKDRISLSELYSRSGSTTGYYQCHNSKNMISVSKPAYKTQNEDFIAEINNRYCGKMLKKSTDTEIILRADRPMELRIFDDACSVSVTGRTVSKALKRPIERENVIKQLNKTGESLIRFDTIHVLMEENVFVPVAHLNELRRDGIKQYEDEILNHFKRAVKEKNNGINDMIQKEFTISKSDSELVYGDMEGENTINISCQINTPGQLNCVLSHKEIKDIYVSSDFLSVPECLESIQRVKTEGKNCYVNLPFIFRKQAMDYVNQLLEQIPAEDIMLSVRNIDELGFVLNHGYDNFVTDSSMYTFNRYAKNFFYKNGAERVTLPYELNYKELKKIADKRDELVIYGRIPLMISAGCVTKNFLQCKKNENPVTVNDSKEINLKKENSCGIILRDRLGAEFHAVNCCNFCYNIIYNNLPLSLLGVSDKVKQLNLRNFRINFTTENAELTDEILEKYIKVFYYNEYSDELKSFTRGHFNRGVD